MVKPSTALNFLFYSILQSSISALGPIVETKWGKIRGFVQTFDGKEVNTFYGIPYAEPPVDKLRFRRPVELKSSFNGEVFDASRIPLNCISAKYPGAKDWVINAPEGEDCLTLDIWVPSKKARDSKNSQLRPVLAYIPGGAFLLDSSRVSGHRPDILAIRGDIIVVFIRYRLGAFGCLFGNRKDMPGNLPLADQLMALKWIKSEIRSFGGDPDRITLAGFSAGGISVAAHYLHPRSNTLFQRAIMMSGSLRTGLEESVPQAMERMKVVAKKVSCWRENDAEVTVDCLRRADPKAIEIAYLESNRAMGGKLALPYCLVAKGSYSPTELDKKLMRGEIPDNIPILMTSMEDDGAVFINQSALMIAYALNSSKRPKEKINEMREIFVPGLKPKQFREITKLYFDGLVGKGDFGEQKAMHQFFGDYFFNCPNLWFAEKVAVKNKVFSAKYKKISQFASKLEPKAIFDTSFGPRHGIDSVYVFGVPLRLSTIFPREDIKTSEFVMSFLSQFIHNGTLPWSPYMESQDVLVPLQFNIIAGTPRTSAEADSRYSYCQVWKKVLYDGKL